MLIIIIIIIRIIPTLIRNAVAGDWLTVVAHARRREGDDDDDDDDGQQQRRQSSCTSFSDEFKAQWFWSMAVGYGIYFTFCGYLEVSDFFLFNARFRRRATPAVRVCSDVVSVFEMGHIQPGPIFPLVILPQSNSRFTQF